MDPANKEEMQQCLQEANEEFSERKDQEMAKAVMHAAAGIVATEEGHHNDCIKDIRGARTRARGARPRARAPSPRARPAAQFDRAPAHPRAAALTGQVQSRHQELAKRRADDPVAKQKVELLGERNRTEEHVKAQQAEVDRHRDAIASEERRGVELGAAGKALKQREAVEVPRARHRSASSPTSRRSAGTTRAPTTPLSRGTSSTASRWSSLRSTRARRTTLRPSTSCGGSSAREPTVYVA